MNYPTLEEVEAADHEQLGRWYRFLKSPGQAYVGQVSFNDKIKEELEILNRIIFRFTELGGWNPQLSKKIGLLDPR